MLRNNNQYYRLRKMALFADGREKVLDIGCSQRPNPYLNNKEVIGFDLIRGVLTDNYTSCEVGNVMDLPNPFQPESFDAIVAGEVIEHLECPTHFLRHCWETLSPKGILILSTPNPNSFFERLLTITLSRKFFYSKDHVSLIPQRWLIRVMENAGFSDVKLYSGGFPLPIIGLVPFMRPWCYQTIATGRKVVQSLTDSLKDEKK